MIRNKSNRGALRIGIIAGVLCLAASVVGFYAVARAADPAQTTDTVQVTISYPASATPIPITVQKGASFSVTLASNPTTGYSWALDGKLNEKIVKSSGNKFIAPPQTNPPMVGRGGVEEWTFNAVSPGTQTITLIYRRPWEKDQPPIKTQKFTVTVK